MIRREISSFVVASVLGLAAPFAVAQQYPSKPIKIVVPVPPGGGSDNIARPLAQQMALAMKGSIIIENKAGAGGIIGSDAVAKSDPDGYTLLLINNAFTINPWLYKSPFDASKDFIPVGMVASAPNVLVAHPSFKPNTVKELIDFAKKEPGKITAAVSTGQMSHLGTASLEQAAGIDIQMIPYRGAAAGDVDLVAGTVNISFGTAPTYIQQIKSGKVKALGVGGKNPLAALPGVPTISQTIPGFEVETWFGVFAPAGTPAEIVDRLQREIAAALKTPAMIERMTSSGYTAGQISREEFAKRVVAETTNWGEIIKKRNIKIE